MLVQDIFDGQKFNPQGLYKVRLFDNGVPYTVIIDDYIPCIEKDDPQNPGSLVLEP